MGRTEAAVGLNLVAQAVLLDAAGIARGLRRPLGVLADVLFQVIGHGDLQARNVSPYS